jgi:hypothetical protein
MVALGLLIPAAGTAAPAESTPAVWPACVFQALPNFAGARLSNAPYRALAFGEIWSKAEPAVLAGLAADAAARGEGYKALYLSRVLTLRHPELSALWRNRAAIAEELQFTAEATQSLARAANLAADTPIVPTIVPGASLATPKTLADWSALVSLMADDVARLSEGPVVIAIPNQVSGVTVPSADEMSIRGAPYAQAGPVLMADIASSLFMLGEANPMRKNVRWGSAVAGAAASLAGAAMLEAGANYAVDTMDVAVAMSETSGRAYARAVATPSAFTGGTYQAWQASGASSALRVRKLQAQPTGEFDAVGLPLPLLLASGASQAMHFEGRFRYNAVLKFDPAAPGVVKPGVMAAEPLRVEIKESRVWIPRVESLCVGSQCWSVTAHEIMLTQADLEALRTSEAAQHSRHVGMWRSSGAEALQRAYDQDPKLIRLAQVRQGESLDAPRSQITLFDTTGRCLIAKIGPDQWVYSANTLGRNR